MAKIKKDNLEMALMLAIEHRRNFEEWQEYESDSIFLAGLKQNLEDLRNDNLKIDYTDG